MPTSLCKDTIITGCIPIKTVNSDGGSDQWGNITTGTELVRRKAGGEAFAFTCPLITKADGTKFGKTEKGNVWLDASKTSAYNFYQFWFKAKDEDAEKWIKIFTFLTPEMVDGLISKHRENPGARELQKHWPGK
nr:hypothetical protein [Paraflavitalea speifideiaquila]